MATEEVKIGDELTAEELKTQGNDCFKKGRYQEAIQLYTQAIEKGPTAVYLSNRAACHLKTEAFGSAIIDATEAIALDSSYIKGYYRRGSANLALSKYKTARKDFLTVAKLKPRDRDARAKLSECDKQIKRKAFEAAIASEHSAPLSETLDVATMDVPAGYKGPCLEGDDPVTLEFVTELMEYFKDQKMLHKKYVITMLIRLKALFESSPSLMSVTVTPEGEPGPSVVSVCGDTHGQFYDLMNIFSINGLPSPENPYVFNGDFVDRGSFSVENVLALFAFKLLYPDSMFLARGNHETTNMNKMYGFEGEVKHKLDGTVMKLFTEVFNALPLATCVNEKVFIVHGGLPQRDGVKLDEVRRLPRGREPGDNGLMSDLLWSDPQPFPGRSPSKRGVGQSFGPDVTARFLEDNGLELLIRSHEVKDDGYLVEHGGKCITVFSAPNYCDQMKNKGAIVRLKADLKPDFVQFTEVPHPPVRPMQYAGNMMSMFGL